MHKLWDFVEKRHIFIIKLKSLTITKMKGSDEKTGTEYDYYEINNPIYEGGKFCDINLKVPKYESDLQVLYDKFNLISKKNYEDNKFINYIVENVDDDNKTNETKYNSILDAFKKQLFQSDEVNIIRGARYVFERIPPKNYDEILFFSLLRNVFSENKPDVHSSYVSNNYYTLSDSEYSQESISSYETSMSELSHTSNINKNIVKQIGSVNDTATTPSEGNYANAFNNQKTIYTDKKYEEMKSSDYPFKFSIVSGTTDGSGMGGEITSEYHPPDIDIYMAIFGNNDKQLKGCIVRISFLKVIYGNSQNTVNKGEIDNHFIYVDFSEIGEKYSEYSDEYPELIKKLLSYVVENTYLIDKNSKIINFALLLPNGSIKKWYKFMGNDCATVKELNETITKLVLLLEKVKKTGSDISRYSDNEQKMLKKTTNETIIELIIGSNVTLIDSILNVAQQLYNNDSILKNYFPKDNIPPEFYNGPLFSRNIEFEIVFLLRNKYTGDKSRATDALFMNKSKFVECMQFSNDENTMFTALMFGLSDLWVTGKRSPSIYLAPYMTGNDAVPFIRFNQNSKLEKGLSSIDSSKKIKIKLFKSKNTNVDEALIVTGKRSRTASSKLTDSEYTTAPAESSESSESSSDKENEPKKVKGILSFSKKPKIGGAIQLSSSQNVNKYITTMPKTPTKSLEPTIQTVAPTKSLEPTIQTITQPINKYVNSYRLNMIHNLKNKATIIQTINAKYKNIDNQNITTIRMFYITMLLKQADYILNNCFSSKTTITEIVDKINNLNNDQFENAIDISTSYNDILELYVETDTFDRYGIEYFFTTPQAQYESGDQVTPNMFKQWNDNNYVVINFVLGKLKYIILNNVSAENIYETFVFNYKIVDNIYSYLDLVDINYLNKLQQNNLNDYTLITFKTISLYYIKYCNLLITHVLQVLNINIDQLQDTKSDKIQSTKLYNMESIINILSRKSLPGYLNIIYKVNIPIIELTIYSNSNIYSNTNIYLNENIINSDESIDELNNLIELQFNYIIDGLNNQMSILKANTTNKLTDDQMKQITITTNGLIMLLYSINSKALKHFLLYYVNISKLPKEKQTQILYETFIQQLICTEDVKVSINFEKDSSSLIFVNSIINSELVSDNIPEKGGNKKTIKRNHKNSNKINKTNKTNKNTRNKHKNKNKNKKRSRKNMRKKQKHTVKH